MLVKQEETIFLLLLIHIFIYSLIFCCLGKNFFIDRLLFHLEYEDFNSFFTTKCNYWSFTVFCFTFHVRKIVVVESDE